MNQFTIFDEDKSCAARTGEFKTPHGSFQTPCFMPCGTKGAVKTLTPDELDTIGCEIILGNTFHLMLRPGEELIAKMGGLHRWTTWDKPILTDSGGFQVFSLEKLRKISDDGVTFQSPIDGSYHFLTPEKSIEIQERLGADIIMAFDECAPGGCDRETAEKAMKRTHDWLLRCFKAKKRKDQALFPIVQGGVYEDLRKESAKFASEIPAPGYAIGGVAVGEGKEKIHEVIAQTAPLLPKDKPRYLMGVGEPEDLLFGVMHGIDMFDCVIPTRLARHGNFWDETGRKDITKSDFTGDKSPLMRECDCYTCQRFSKSYLKHLMIEKEILGHRLLTIHNLHFLVDLMSKIRASIKEGTLKSFAKNFTTRFNADR